MLLNATYARETAASQKVPITTERALPETMCLHGLDDILLTIQPILTQPQETHSFTGRSDNASN